VTRTVRGTKPDGDLSVDEIFDAVVGLLFPGGAVPTKTMTSLLRWRDSTQRLLDEVNGG
jgi:hypothetical protein